MKQKAAPTQAAVLAILSDGQPHSNFELNDRAKTSDARTAISHLRAKGVRIGDEWCVNSQGVRYKVYTLPQFRKSATRPDRCVFMSKSDRNKRFVP